MSVRIARRRLGQAGLSSLPRPSTRRIWPLTLHRNASNRPVETKPSDAPDAPSKLEDKAKTTQDDPLANPLVEEYLRKRKETQKEAKRPEFEKATLPPTSLFHPDRLIPGVTPNMSPEEYAEKKAEAEEQRRLLEERREAEMYAEKLDPKPEQRKKWEQRMVIRSLRRRGRMTVELKRARTERESLYKSPNLPTSVKKLTKVMQQIQGKTLEEAFVQLRFSKKRVAKDVFKGLQLARDEAIVARGMGVPQRLKGTTEGEANTPHLHGDEGARTWESDKTRAIELKDGTTKKIKDPSEIYIDQAWVGKGVQWKSPEYRARGKVNLLTHRTTSFSVVLKEEKTRMRISNEIKKKRDNRKLWVALPDRPITTQRQYCLW
ncbi:ribosomal protein L22/L17 [Lophiotrema nucula]|uniref:Ribosomal protein L22/L17 n=1 Tax=Lophiotrema nucula TaxID=690887 RepID=A0A6A5Z5S4_9PLEO|nr:ribosomal protein L22/L17 [Lophiotrema nucula]